jgi:hypothetical protein
MKRSLAGNLATWTLLALSLTPIARGQNCDEYVSNHPALRWENLQPLVLLREYGEFGDSDRITFVLYVDGTVIYWQGNVQTGKYQTTKLSSAQLSQFIEDAHFDNIETFKECYAISHGLDAPSSSLFVKTSQGYKYIFVYGNIQYVKKASQTELPPDLQTAYKALLTFHADGASDWRPPYFEVNIWRYKEAKSWLAWPSDLPNLKDKNTVRDTSGITTDGYFIYIPISKWDEYESFAKKLKPTQAVLLDGKKWP